MVYRQIADEAGQKCNAIRYGGDHNPGVSDDPKFSSLLFDVAGFCVCGGGDQFVLADVQNTADLGNQGNIGIGNTSLPFAHGTLCDKEEFCQIFLGIVFLGPLGLDEGTEGLFVGHMESPLVPILG